MKEVIVLSQSKIDALSFFLLLVYILPTVTHPYSSAITMSIRGNQSHQISTTNIEQEEIPVLRTNSSTESQQ